MARTLARSLRQSVAVTCLCAQADKKAVGWYKSFAEKRAVDPQYQPSKRGTDANLWQALNRYSNGHHPSYEMDVPTLRLFALQPDMLGGAGAKFYGEVSDVAPWRWTFRAAADHHGIDSLRDVEGVAHGTRQAALAERLDACNSFTQLTRRTRAPTLSGSSASHRSSLPGRTSEG